MEGRYVLEGRKIYNWSQIITKENILEVITLSTIDYKWLAYMKLYHDEGFLSSAPLNYNIYDIIYIIRSLKTIIISNNSVSGFADESAHI